MAHFESRFRLALVTLVALSSACARSTGTNTGQTEPATPPNAARPSGVTAEDVERAPNVPIEQLLQSKVPGIIVSRTADGSIAIRIRGSSTLTGSNEPLYVVDGMPIQAGPNGGLTGINPYDIASIKVLKDPAETTMYGVRGANGVIIIKTKRPNQ